MPADRLLAGRAGRNRVVRVSRREVGG